jgi:hypothetical protein
MRAPPAQLFGEQFFTSRAALICQCCGKAIQGIAPPNGLCGNPLSLSLLGVKRTWSIALHMSANDPKRTMKFNFDNKKGAALRPRQIPVMHQR